MIKYASLSYLENKICFQRTVEEILTKIFRNFFCEIQSLQIVLFHYIIKCTGKNYPSLLAFIMEITMFVISYLIRYNEISYFTYRRKMISCIFRLINMYLILHKKQCIIAACLFVSKQTYKWLTLKLLDTFLLYQTQEPNIFTKSFSWNRENKFYSSLKILKF